MGYGVSACATCDGFFFKGLEVVVVGGGDTAVEEATFLTKFATKVTIVHRRDQLRASKIMAEKAKKNPKIAFAWDSVVEEILGKNENGRKSVTGIRLKNVKTGATSDVKTDGVFMGIGHKPNTDLFAGQLDMDDVGYLKTNGAQHVHEYSGSVRGGRRCRQRLPTGRDGRGDRLHGGNRRGALARIPARLNWTNRHVDRHVNRHVRHLGDARGNPRGNLRGRWRELLAFFFCAGPGVDLHLLARDVAMHPHQHTCVT